MDELPITDPSIHANLLLESKEDVFKKYSVVQVLGNGSMGTVSKVKIKKHKVGGSAFQPKSKGVFGFLKKQNNKRKEGETREHNSQDYIYALKSIILDRVSSVFLDELRNEILILRSLDHPNIVKAHEVYYTRKQIYLGA
jgi:serine/threonine protein kinase